MGESGRGKEEEGKLPVPFNYVLLLIELVVKARENNI